MYTGTIIDELMETVERTALRATEYTAEDGQKTWTISLPEVQNSFAGAA